LVFQGKRRLERIWVALQDIVEQTVSGLGYDLVEVERSAGGLLRVTIDLPWSLEAQPAVAGAPEAFVTVEDCEKVTRQLQFALEVEGIDYKRLEISSPGIDRLLRHEQDFIRFQGEQVDITLKEALGAQAGGQVAANRKKFRGALERTEAGWQITWRDALVTKPGQKPGKKKLAEQLVHALGFTLDELKEARLAPVVDFKGRKSREAAPSAEQGF
jgi:ribosome maturation factor RimP